MIDTIFKNRFTWSLTMFIGLAAFIGGGVLALQPETVEGGWMGITPTPVYLEYPPTPIPTVRPTLKPTRGKPQRVLENTLEGANLSPTATQTPKPEEDGLPYHETPLLASWYDPALGGINCDNDCTTFANGEKVTESKYGNTIACIKPWVGMKFEIKGLGTFWCRDTGGAIISEYVSPHGFVHWIDVLSHSPVDRGPYHYYRITETGG